MADVIQLPGVELEERIGEGGMAVVWRARQVSLDRIVAIKILKAEFAADPEDVDAFIEEARSAARLKHPNIIQVYDVAEHAGLYYFVMEYIDGTTVADLLTSRGALDPGRALKIALATAEALRYAWDKAHIVHRDVKPDNIMIDADGSVKLADLGLAKSLDPLNLSTQLRTGILEGTPNYISPEQARCAVKLDCRADMYSLGATLYHALTGRIPFGDCTPMEALARQADGHLENPRDVNPAVSAGAALLVSRLMMKDPAHRYPDWSAAIRDIRKVLAERVLMAHSLPDAPCTIKPACSLPTTPATSRRAQTHIPIWVRLPAWTFLIALWAGLAAFILRPVLPSRPATAPAVPAAATVQPPTPVAPAVVSPLQPQAAAPAPAAPEPAPATNPEPPPDPEAVRRALLHGVARALQAEQFDSALAALDNVDPALDAFVREVSTLNSRVLAGLGRQMGREIVVTVGGLPVRLVPRAISGNRVNARLIEGNAGESRSVTFSVDSLPPVEREHWLGKIETPAEHAMAFILRMQAGDKERAAQLAPRCGVLAEAFGDLAAGDRTGDP